MTDNDLRWTVAALVAALVIFMGARSAILRRAGVPVNQLGARGNWSQRILVSLAAVLDIYLLARAPLPILDHWVGASASPAPMAALVVLIVASLIIIAAQGGMGKSWRVGVPSGSAEIDALVTGGLNRLSRNPIYLGIMFFLVGVALAAPGPLTFAALVISFLGLNAVISKEERYLKDRFGADYDDYARRVRRWI